MQRLGSLSEISVKVQEAGGEMKIATEHVVGSQVGIKDVSAEVVGGMDEIVQGTQHMSEAMTGVSSIVGRLGKSAEELTERVDRFKTEGQTSSE